jgi:iron complex outermembrane receptor protein
VSPLRTFLLGKEDSKEFLRSAGISYKVDEEAMIYARYAEGFLPGGFDENAMSAFTGNSYGSETNRSFEIGLKSDWQQDRLRVNVAYLETQLNNKLERFNTLTPEGDIESMLDNVAQVEVSGWELELESIPLDRLRIKMAYSHLNANYDSYHVPDLENPGSYINLSHLTSNRAPGNNLFLSANYSLPIGPGTLHTYAAYRLLKDYQTNSLIPEAEVSNWTAWDLSVAYEWREWQFRLFSKNVKNKEYIQNVNRILQTDILPVGAGSVSVPSLVTFTEYNQPRYTGFEIIYQPDF